LHDAYESGAISSVKFYETIKKRFRCEINFERFKNIWNSLLVKRDDMFRIALDIGKSIDLFALSNTNEINAEILVRDLKGIIKDAVFSFEVGCIKPEQRIFKIALERVGQKPESVLFIDDREENIDAARDLGIDSHLFKSLEGLVEFLGTYGVKTHGL
jgi:putative hydrolase of the HAD superfamily